MYFHEFNSQKERSSSLIGLFKLFIFLPSCINQALVQQVFYLSVHTSEFIIGPLFKKFISRLIYPYHKGFFAFAFRRVLSFF